MLNVRCVYVVHYTRLPARKANVLHQLDGVAPVKFIEPYDREELTPEVMAPFYRADRAKWEDKVRPLWDLRQHGFRHLKMPEISCTIKHIEAVRRVAENGDALIVEDDVQFNEGFVERFNRLKDQLPDDWDAVIYGSCCNLHASTVEGQELYKVSHPATRCLDAYMVRQQAAQKVMTTVYPFQLVSDWELAYQFYHHDLNVYWVEPVLCDQGSVTGAFRSELR